MRVRPLISLLSLTSLALLLALAQTPLSLAQDSPSTPRETPAAWDFVMPFRYEGLLFTDVSVNHSARKFNFLIDSGASTTMLSLRVAERLAVTMTDSPIQAQGVGTQELKLASDVTLTVGTLEYQPLMCGVLDTAHIGDSDGLQLDGILGADFLFNFREAEFDFLDMKARFRNWKAGEKPATFEDIAARLQKALGGSGIPGMPGGDGIDDKDDAAPRKVDGFPIRQLHNTLKRLPAQVGAPAAPTAQARKSDAEYPSHAVDLNFFEAKIPEMLQALLGIEGEHLLGAALWFVEAEIQGGKANFLFDTGASSMIVLDQQFARDQGLRGVLDFTVSGVGTSPASLAEVTKFKLGGHREDQAQAAILMDLQTVFSQMDNPMLGMLGLTSPKPQGIVGLPFALRYRKMGYNFKDRKLSFTPYTEAELQSRNINPHEGEGFLMQAVTNAAKNNHGKPGFSGSPLDVRNWPEEGVEKGLVVSDIESGSHAEAAGLEAGDLVVAIVLSEEEARDFGISGDEMPVGDMNSLIFLAAAEGKEGSWKLRLRKKRTDTFVIQEFKLGPAR